VLPCGDLYNLHWQRVEVRPFSTRVELTSADDAMGRRQMNIARSRYNMYGWRKNETLTDDQRADIEHEVRQAFSWSNPAMLQAREARKHMWETSGAAVMAAFRDPTSPIFRQAVDHANRSARAMSARQPEGRPLDRRARPFTAGSSRRLPSGGGPTPGRAVGSPRSRRAVHPREVGFDDQPGRGSSTPGRRPQSASTGPGTQRRTARGGRDLEVPEGGAGEAEPGAAAGAQPEVEEEEGLPGDGDGDDGVSLSQGSRATAGTHDSDARRVLDSISGGPSATQRGAGALLARDHDRLGD
jgi:hypothetical protein